MVLFIDACVRSNSRTRDLAEVLLSQLGKYETVKLSECRIYPLDEQSVNKRIDDSKRNIFDDSMYNYAKQFRDADEIVIAAPYWDCSFPSCLKDYIEQVCVVGLTFKYSESGIPIGLCKAKKLHYITTAGGTIYNREFGFGYIKTLAQTMFGIKECFFYSAENLDIVGNDAQAILNQAKDRISRRRNVQ